jgi:peptidoglycan/LPS O-acetylase OafA/YrhL
MKRFWRLVPTMWIGILLGAAYAWWSGNTDILGLQLAFALAFLPVALGPFGIFMLNGVQWSLFFELFANAAHATVLWQLRTKTLAAYAAIAFAILSVAAWHFGTACVGDRGPSFVAGFARVFAPYIAGMVLFRLKDRLPTVHVWPASLLVGIVLVAGWVGPKWIVELLAIALMPVVLIGGIQRGSMCPRLAQRAGWLSYPLYAVHLPTLYFVHRFAADSWAGFAVGAGLSIAVAWVVAWLVSKIQAAGQFGQSYPLRQESSSELPQA